MDFVKDILHIASFGVYEGNNPNKESRVPSRPEPREMSDSRDDDFEKAIRHKKQLERDADARRIAKHNAKIYKRNARQQARNKFFAQFFPFLYTTYYPLAPSVNTMNSVDATAVIFAVRYRAVAGQVTGQVTQTSAT